MTYKYNKVRHLELFRRFLDLEKQGKDLYMENRDEYLEFLHYQSRVEDSIFWKSREEFAFLMENLINDSIDMEQFKIAFSRLWWKSIKEDDIFKEDERDLKRVKNFQHNPRSDGFCGLVTAVFRQFEVLEDEDCTEQEVKDYVRDTLQEIQPYL